MRTAVGRHPGPDREPALHVHRAHRLDRVDHEVHDDLMDLVASLPDRRHGVAKIQGDLDVTGAQVVPEQLDGFLDDRVQRHRRTLRRPLARQRKKVPDDPRTAVGAGEDLLGALDQRGLARPVAEQMGLSHHDRERVVELVRDAREQGAHRRDLLALHQALGTLGDDLLERAVVAVEIEVEAARVQEVSNPQHDLEAVERLRQEVLGAGLEGALLRVAGRVGREHQNRQEDVFGNVRLLDDRDPVQVRHHQVEQDEIGLKLAVERDHLTRVRRALDVPVAAFRQHALEEPRLPADRRRPGSGPGPGLLSHGYLTARASSSSSTPRNSATDSGFVR